VARGDPTVGFRHGTTPGWHRHQTLREAPCDACTAAKAAYDARRRERPGVLEQARLRSRAQHRALKRLSKIYPDVYQLLYEEEKRRVEREEARDDPGR
jgi:hypothetical protein